MDIIGSKRCYFCEVVDVAELLKIDWRLFMLDLQKFIKLTPAAHLDLAPVRLVFTDYESAPICLPLTTTQRGLHLLELLLGLLQLGQRFFLLQASKFGLLCDIVAYLYENGNFSVILCRRLLLLAKYHLSVGFLLVVCLINGRVKYGLPELFFRFCRSFLPGDRQFLQTGLPAVLLLPQFILVLLLVGAITMLAPCEDAH